MGLITALKTGRPLEIHGFYMKNYEKDLHTRDDILFLDIKLIIPAAARGAFSFMLHESHPGQFGMKFLAEIIRWPHTYSEKHHHGKSCTQCSKAGKNLKVLLGSEHMSNALVVDSGSGNGFNNCSHRNNFHIPALQIYFLLTNTVEKNYTSQTFTV